MTATSTAPREPTARRIPGEQGTWVFLFGDMLVFAVFFATFMVERSKAPELFDAARATLHIGVGLTNTLVLVHQFAVCRGGDRSHQIRGEIDCHRGDYGGDRVRPHVHRAEGARVRRVACRRKWPGENHFYLYYFIFILTGLHLFHVCLGIAVLVFLLTQARRTELSANRTALIEGGACFWHLVDLLWIFLFALLYLVS